MQRILDITWCTVSWLFVKKGGWKGSVDEVGGFYLMKKNVVKHNKSYFLTIPRETVEESNSCWARVSSSDEETLVTWTIKGNMDKATNQKKHGDIALTTWLGRKVEYLCFCEY